MQDDSRLLNPLPAVCVLGKFPGSQSIVLGQGLTTLFPHFPKEAVGVGHTRLGP